MSSAQLAAFAGTAALLLLLLATLLGLLVAGRRRHQRELAVALASLEQLQARVEALSSDLEAAAAPPTARPGHGGSEEYVITSAGAVDTTTDERLPVSDRTVLSVTFGEPLVKMVAFGYGLRRAFSPETRNRIAFEMRREVRRSRKQRRRQARAAVREARRREAAA